MTEDVFQRVVVARAFLAGVFGCYPHPWDCDCADCREVRVLGVLGVLDTAWSLVDEDGAA